MGGSAEPCDVGSGEPVVVFSKVGVFVAPLPGAGASVPSDSGVGEEDVVVVWVGGGASPGVGSPVVGSVLRGVAPSAAGVGAESVVWVAEGSWVVSVVTCVTGGAGFVTAGLDAVGSDIAAGAASGEVGAEGAFGRAILTLVSA